MWENLTLFLENAVPSWCTIFIFVPLTTAYALLSAGITVYFKKKKGLKTSYTRKIFHLFIFCFAGFLQIFYGLSTVMILGGIVSLLVLITVYKGSGFAFYDALARPSDRPHQTLFILIPLATTALGGVLSNVFFLKFASIGYFIGGFGDAAGEPAGARFGKHWYKVPSLAGVSAKRSLEGSTAVFISSIIAGFFGFLLLDFPLVIGIQYALICAFAATVVEAFSSHGLDNLTIQITASGVAYLLVTS
ncbi:MAG: hypothetical protein ACNS60_01050 [Candidatus Cyclobacteriaceae bacterium M2_1C_046]